MGYRVRYVGRELPARDFDGWAAALRLVASDGQYVQFFRAIAAAPDLIGLEPRPAHDWWTEFIHAAARQIEQLVTEGSFTPGPPGEPMYIRPDVAAVHQASRKPNPGRRHFTATEPSIDGVDVIRFGVGEDLDERRRTPR